MTPRGDPAFDRLPSGAGAREGVVKRRRTSEDPREGAPCLQASRRLSREREPARSVWPEGQGQDRWKAVTGDRCRCKKRKNRQSRPTVESDHV